jgi:hypothetical protein
LSEFSPSVRIMSTRIYVVDETEVSCASAFVKPEGTLVAPPTGFEEEPKAYQSIGDQGW